MTVTTGRPTVKYVPRDDHKAATGPVLSRRMALDVVALGDVASCVAGCLASAALMTRSGDGAVAWLPLVETGLLTSLLTYSGLRHFECYDINRVHKLPVRPLRCFGALLVALAIVFGLGLPVEARGERAAVWYGIWLLVSFTLLVGNRVLAHTLLGRAARRGGFRSRIAIYGTGALADRICDVLRAPGQQATLVGAFDDRHDFRRQSGSGPARLGGLDDLIALGRSGAVDQVIIALPQAADLRTAQVARRLEQLPVSLHIVTHFATDLADKASRHRVSVLGEVGLLDIKSKPMADWGRHLKTFEDLVIGTLALILAAPVMAVVALAIKLDSPGPVLFSQRRRGLHHRTINVLKFRSMRVMEDGGDVRQATATDPRVTRVGGFLRRTSLDELPQLFNVLRGEMSLIGPRPHALVHDDLYGDMLERYANRHQVKPGMTGWAQVCGFRGPTETPDKMQARIACDLVYIDRWSLWFDLKILVLTVFVGFRHRNAV